MSISKMELFWYLFKGIQYQSCSSPWCEIALEIMLRTKTESAAKFREAPLQGCWALFFIVWFCIWEKRPFCSAICKTSNVNEAQKKLFRFIQMRAAFFQPLLHWELEFEVTFGLLFDDWIFLHFRRNMKVWLLKKVEISSLGNGCDLGRNANAPCWR